MNTIFAEYDRRAAARSDIQAHLPKLRALARECQTIAEFGVRTGNSTIAFLAGLADRGGGRLLSYDLNPPQVQPPPIDGVEWIFHQQNTAVLPELPAVDLLFIDTLHAEHQVRAELCHADRARHYLVFHDTQLFGWRDESTGHPIGINRAIYDWLLSPAGHAQGWQVFSHDTRDNGLTVLNRKS